MLFRSTTDANLKRGDIIVRAGYHTVIVLENGANITPANTNQPVTGAYTGTSVVEYLKSIGVVEDV